MEYVINSNHKPDCSLQSVLFNHQDRLFDCHSKLLLLRVDFAYRKNSDSYAYGDIHQLVAEMTWLTEQCAEISGLEGYAWVMEYGEITVTTFMRRFISMVRATGRPGASGNPSSCCGRTLRTEKATRTGVSLRDITGCEVNE